MSTWLRILERFRLGAASRDELLATVESLLGRGYDATLLSAATRAEHARNPLPAGSLEAIEDRMSRAQQKTLAQPAPSAADNDNTQFLDRSNDATQLLRGNEPPDNWRTPVEVNSILLGRFKLVQLIGEGGMSDVYKAIDLRKVEAGARDPHLAVKVLTVRFDDYFSSLSVMNQEASKLQTLTHPNIVRVNDCDRDGQTVFMTMEYLDGISLKFKMPKNRADKKMPRDEAFRIVAAISGALEFAHRKHIVHGDLKPGNVILTTSGDIKVIDFGIARFLRRPQDDEVPTEDWEGNFTALTPPYASPEMHDGAEADARDDIYALACVTYELLVGEHPFGGTPSVNAREAGLAVPSSKRLRAHEYRALQHGLQFERSKRTPSAQQFLDELNGTRMRTQLVVAMWVAISIVVLVGAIFAGRTMKTSPIEAVSPVTPLTAGSVFRDCPTCPLMRVLAQATFEQGSPAGNAGALPFEQPAHAVTIAYPFAAGINEVTVGEFAEFAKEYPRERSGCATYDGEWRERGDISWRNATQQQNAMYPVTCVSWQDASDYAAWLSLRTGETYRLPSASEWEYLARAGTAGLPWSNTAAACANANAADASAARRFPGWKAFACSDNYAETAPVGSFAPNAFGLTDTLGNVFEWVQDCWRENYAGAPTDGSPVLEGNCNEREARGGSWFTTPEFVRPAYRNRFDAGYRSNSLGFRLVRELKKQ
jgi:formylglycine-generating enzyme required for sulfatase activity/predicted Ser/Thr protein kinase